MNAFPGTARAVEAAINAIKVGSIQEAEQRGKMASGRTASSLSVFVVAHPFGVTGVLEGNDNWKYWGNGRGPGRMPPIRPIQDWIDATGSDLNAWAVAKSIAAKGTRDFQLKQPNIVLTAVAQFENGQGMDNLENEAGKEMEDKVVELTYLKLTRR